MVLAIKPGRKRFKVALVKIVLFVLGRSLQTVSKLDRQTRSETEQWPEGYKVMYKVLPNGPRMGLVRNREGFLSYRGKALEEETADLVVNLKNIECAFLLLSLQIGTTRAYAENRISVRGSLQMVMSLTRCLNMTETYLLPHWIAKRVVKRVPRIPMLKRQLVRLAIYTVGIPFGL